MRQRPWQGNPITKTRNAGLGVTTYNYDTRGQVTAFGPWHYSGNSGVGASLDAFTQVNYGAAGAAKGYPPTVLLRVAGVDQWVSDSSGHSGDSGQGVPFGAFPYGDTPSDAAWIALGIGYYYSHYDSLGLLCN
jgi:hypothetical protein